MRSFKAFAGKEVCELVRTGRLSIYLVIFVLFGILNPAIAKLTPWLMETFEESFTEVGFVVAEIEVDAMDSWTQFYKNLPILLIVFVILSGNIVTGEYQRGTLIPMLTKGLQRWKVIAAKGLVLLVLWSICYWMYYGITYGYTAYFWDNGIASHLFFGALCPYIFGIWLISLILLMSVPGNGSTAVLSGCGGLVVFSYLLGMIPAAASYLPTGLLASGELLTGGGMPADYAAALAVTGILTIVFLLLAVVGFNRKSL